MYPEYYGYGIRRTLYMYVIHGINMVWMQIIGRKSSHHLGLIKTNNIFVI